MRSQATRPRILRRCALAAGLLVCLGPTGCKEGDPLEAIRQQQKAGDYAGTTEPLRELLAEHPDDAQANFLYGRALAFTHPSLAVWSLREAMKDPEWFVPAGTQLALLALAGQDFNEAVKVTSRMLEREPDNVQILMMRANAYAHSKRDPELALADAKRILEIDPHHTEAYEPMILALIGLGRLDEAKQALAEVGRLLTELEVDERLLAWHCATTAVFQRESGEIEQARETWAACVDAHPSDPDVVSSAVEFYDEQGEADRSLEVLRAARELAPDSALFRALLVRSLNASGDTAEAEAVLREATRSEKPELAAAAWMDLAQFHQAMGEHGARADALERAIELLGDESPPNPQLLFEYADALVLADRLDRALEVAEDLPVPAHRLLIQGRVAQERRHPARALALFDEAMGLWPNNPWARHYAALAALELGDFERALKEFRNSVRIQPGATDARTRGAELLLAAGEPYEAVMMLQTAAGVPLEIEGQLLGMRLSGFRGDTIGVADYLAMIQASHPGWAGRALAEAAEGLVRRGGPALAVSMLTTAPGIDFSEPRYAPALHALVRFSHQADQPAAKRAVLQTALAAHPDSGLLQAIHGLDLELSGAPEEAVQAAYARALELGPRNAWALAGLGRLALGDDPAAALDFFDRAASADPSDPELKLAAARALVAAGKPDEAAERLDALLLAHPFEAVAAAERAQLDLERGIATPATLERAQRAVRFGGGVAALELLSRVHAQRDEPELAAQAAEAARALREAPASKG